MTESEWLASTDPARMLEWLLNGRGNLYRTTPNGIPIGVSHRKLRLFGCACCHIFGTPGNLVDDYEREWVIGRTDRDWAESWASRYSDDKIAGPKAATFLRDIVGNPFRPVRWRHTATLLCGICGQFGHTEEGWHPEVCSLAQAAYDGRCPDTFCTSCSGQGAVEYLTLPEPYWVQRPGPPDVVEPPLPIERRSCPDCHGTGRTGGGCLDLVRLAILADALEEAGCPIEEKTPCPGCSQYARDPANPYKQPGYRPERDPASGRHEGGWTNCKTCNSGGRDCYRPGVVRQPHPLLTHLRSPGPHVRGCWAVDLILGKE